MKGLTPDLKGRGQYDSSDALHRNDHVELFKGLSLNPREHHAVHVAVMPVARIDRAWGDWLIRLKTYRITRFTELQSNSL